MVSSECNKKIVKVSQSDGICHIILNDPGKKNALSKCMIKALLDNLDSAVKDSNQKVIVIRGNGGVFSSGADLKWMKNGLHQSEAENKNDAELFYQLYETINNCPKPIIVCAEKYAFGGAIGLLTCADFVIADKDLILAFSEVKLGIIPATIAPFIIYKIGLSQARKLLISAQPFNAKVARKIGLVHEVVKSKDMSERLDAVCKQFLANSPSAMAQTKSLINEIGSNQLSTSEIKNLCIDKIMAARSSDDGQEGVTAFFEKRQANW